MGKRFGNWAVLRDISEGGQGWVYLVQHVDNKQQGALKRLKNSARQARFALELEAVNKIKHPNVVSVLDADVQGKQPFIVFEYIDGRSLGEIPHEELHQTPIEARIDWFLQICRGLAAAHHEGVIHRDLKPENIIVGSNQKISLCDFGLAFVDDDRRLTATLEQMGSRYYMAPECEMGRTEAISEATGVYSLGKILYFLLSGGTMFSREAHRTEQYNLATLTDDPFMESYSRILDSMIVEDPVERKKDVISIANAVREADKRYRGRYPVPGIPETYKCVFCGVGKYEQVFPKQGVIFENLGYSPLHGYQSFAFLECDTCGNAQRFRLQNDHDGWFSENPGHKRAPRRPT